jgi:hypothetical protein
MKPIILIPALAVAVLFAACKEQGGNITASDNSNVSAIAQTAAKTVYGEVYKTVGNQLTVKVLDGEFDPQKLAEQQSNQSNRGSMTLVTGADGKISMPEGVTWGGNSIRNRPSSETGAGNSAQGGTDEKSGGSAITRPPEQTDGNGSRVVPTDESGNPVTFTRPPEQTDENGSRVQRPAGESGNPAGMPSRTGGKTYTGEELDIIIPIGTPITTYVLTDGTVTEKESDIADIKNGSTVFIEYADGETVSKVHIVPAVSRGGGSGGQGRFGGGNFSPEMETQINDALRSGNAVAFTGNEGQN